MIDESGYVRQECGRPFGLRELGRAQARNRAEGLDRCAPGRYNRRMADPGESKWKKIRSLPGRLYAEQMQDILKQEGIPSLLKGDDVGIFGPGAGSGSSVLGIMLWVPEQFEARAKELVEAYLDGI